ncbi:hypothetical protein D3C75_707090 [compost metagenome]
MVKRLLDAFGAAGEQEQEQHLADHAGDVAVAAEHRARAGLQRGQARGRAQHQQLVGDFAVAHTVPHGLHRFGERARRHQPADGQRPQACEQGIEIAWQAPAPEVTLDALDHGQEARQAGAERHDLAGPAGQQQLFILVAQGRCHLAHHQLQGTATQLAQAVQLARQAIQALPAVHGKDDRGGNRPVSFGTQFLEALADLPVLGEGWRPFQYRALGQAQQLVATGVAGGLRRPGGGEARFKPRQFHVARTGFAERIAPEMLQVAHPTFAAVHLGQAIDALVERTQALYQPGTLAAADDQQ